jgi:predicted RecA/RadA family phage recombinase
MARNYVGEGDVLNYANGNAAVASGAVVVFGKRVGVVLADIPANSVGAVSVDGVWTLPKHAADVVGMGDDLYWDAAAHELTTTAGANARAGYAAAAAGAGVTTADLVINL